MGLLNISKKMFPVLGFHLYIQEIPLSSQLVIRLKWTLIELVA